VPDIQPILDHAGPYLMVVFRVAGLFLAAPILSSRVIPTRFKALLAIMLAAAVYPLIPAGAHLSGDVDLLTLAPVVASEALIGLTIGLLAMMPLAGVQLAGMLCGYQMGLMMAQAYNPDADTETNVVGQLLFYMAFASYVALGGLEAMFLAVARTFERIPVGGMAPGDAPLELAVGLLGSAFELGFRVAAPVLCITALLMIGMAVVMKTMPQINILTVGFAVKIVAGLAILAAGLYAVQEVIHADIEHVLGAIAAWSGGA
jgi:flagellar biosynthesis protein FliR